MSSCRSRARTVGDAEQSSLPPADSPPPPPPPSPKDAERDDGGNRHVEEPNEGPEPGGSRSAGEANQEGCYGCCPECTLQPVGDTEDAYNRLIRRSWGFGIIEICL